VILQKGQTRFEGFDNDFVSIFTRHERADVKAQLQDLYGVESQPD
jgi:hypothetical protein